ncbi:MAG TPA: hypothetical protein VJV78_14625 [Polyangiales bacterium]|nr:hypothetical protein [Polyangiales bacterium]
MLRIATLFGTGVVVLMACGADAGSSQSAIGQEFDELASAIKACAQAHGSCKGDKPSQDTAGRCREQFLDCRAKAGKGAEEGLAAAISDCQDRHKECSGDSDELACDQELHACIGEQRPPGSLIDKIRPMPDANASTYQCFGMLRECAASKSAANSCVAQARTCVATAVGEPPDPNPRPATP